MNPVLDRRTSGWILPDAVVFTIAGLCPGILRITKGLGKSDYRKPAPPGLRWQNDWSTKNIYGGSADRLWISQSVVSCCYEAHD